MGEKWVHLQLIMKCFLKGVVLGVASGILIISGIYFVVTTTAKNLLGLFL
jgi:hypothetical protein